MTPEYYSRLQIQTELTFYGILEDYLNKEIVIVQDELDALSPDDPGAPMTRVIFEGIIAYLKARKNAVNRGLWETKKKQVL